MAVLRAAHVERVSVQAGNVRIPIDKHELRLLIDELAYQPRTRGPVDMDIAAGYPPHAEVSAAAAASRNSARALSHRASKSSAAVLEPSGK